MITLYPYGKYGLQASFPYHPVTVAMIKRCLGWYWESENGVKAWVSDGPEVLLDMDREHIEYRVGSPDAADRINAFYERLDVILQIKAETFGPELYSFQVPDTEILTWQGRGLNASEMGLGKGVVSIKAADRSRLEGIPNLFVTLGSLTWNARNEILKWFPDASVEVCEGTPKQRAEFWSRVREAPPDWVVTNYEKLILEDWPWDMIWGVFIFDEASRIKNKKTQTWGVVAQLVQSSYYAFPLTGSPIEIKLQDLHSIMAAIRPAVLGSWTRFREQHLITDAGGNTIGINNVELLQERIGPWVTRRKKEEVAPWLPPKIYMPPVLFDLSAKEKAEYDRIDEEFEEWCLDNDRPITQVNEMVELMRLQQFTSSPVLLGLGDSWRGSKYEELLDDLREHQDLACVFTRFKPMAHALLDWLHKDGLPVHPQAIISGDIKSAKERTRRQDEFNAGRLGRIFIFTDAGAYGLNFQGSLVCHYDLLWNPEKMKQREDRLHGIGRGGRNGLVIRYYLAKRTVDEGMWGVLQDRKKLSRIVDGAEEVVLNTLGRSRLRAIARGEYKAV